MAKKVMLKMVMVGVLVCACSQLIAKPGKSALASLKIPTGARAAALAGAYVTGSGAEAIWWNVAGISAQNKWDLLLMQNYWFEGISQQFISYVFEVGANTCVGIGVHHISAKDIDGRDIYGAPTGKFDMRDLALIVGLSRTLNQSTKIGASVKIIQEKIQKYSGIAYAIDGGITKQITEKVIAGVSFSNLGSKLKLDREGCKLPLILRAGLSVGNIVSIQADYTDGQINGTIGVEWQPVQLLALRAGYTTWTAKQKLGKFKSIPEGMSVGIGINIKPISIDYAFVPYGDLKDTHRIALSLRF